MRRIFAFVCSLLVYASFAVPALAHAQELSLEERVGEYLIDIGYNQQLVANEEILFDFNLYNFRRDGLQEKADYGEVSFDVILNSTTVFNRQIPRNESLTAMSVVFPTSGQYGLNVAFYRGGEKFAEHRFVVTVANALPPTGLVTPLNIVEIGIYAVALLVCVGAGIGLLIMRSRRAGLPPQA